MPQWNPQQLKAITTKNKNVLVSASAGSGKTTVLIARLIDLVMKDHVSIDQILAMTFTEAAANEMKKRLAYELQQLYKTTTDDKERQYISTQLTNVQTAHISTIHSFCLSIIQEYYYTIGLHPKRVGNIMDNGLTVALQSEALNKAMQQEYEQQDPYFIALCEVCSSRVENNDTLERMIIQLATLASSKADPDTWLQSVVDAYEPKKSIFELPNETIDTFFDYLNVQITIYIELLNEIKKQFELLYSDQNKKIAQLYVKLGGLEALTNALMKKDYETFIQAMIQVSKIVTPACPDKSNQTFTKQKKMIETIENNLLAILYPQSTYLKDMEENQHYIAKLVEMCRNYRKNYAQLKEEEKAMDFDDMEHFALEILQANNGEVANVYREQFVEIMVDEFQDSNDVQNELVMLICKENNVFRVGDIKQSIYGFRHAKPSLMRGLIQNKGPLDEVIYLSNNYRSKKMIVDFNNDLFKQLMNTPGFSCSYVKEDDVETGVPAQEENNVPTVFHALYHAQIKEDIDGIVSKNEIKANYIANQIAAIKEQENRQWRDFVVLVRGNARKDDMKKAFDQLNIPYFIDIKHGFYQSNAVSVVLSALRSFLHPHDDLNFTAAMFSPLFQMQEETFARAKLAKEKNASYFSYFKEQPIPAIQTYLEFLPYVHNSTLCEMLDRIYNCNNYYMNHTTMQEKTNLDLLYEKAVQFEEKNGSGIAGFLQYIHTIKDAQTAEAIPIGSEDNVVRVMSIHQSKGLQFPVVFLWSMDAQKPIEFSDLCIFDSDLGIALKHIQLPERIVHTTIQRVAMEHKKNKEELEEEMRILYVATTRAQQQMHIVDCIKDVSLFEKPLTTASVYAREGYTSWILQTFLTTPSPLFKIHYVTDYWPQRIQEESSQEYQHIQMYEQPYSTMHITTATTIKQKELDFSFHDKKGSRRGSALHTIIEALPSKPWTKEEILQTSKNKNFVMKQRELNSLLQLSQNEIFKQAQTNPNIYHELPYMVKQEDTISHGFIDYVSYNDTDMILIDFKSDYVDEPNILVTRYSEQLHTYEKALHVLYPTHKIHTYVYSLHLNEMIEI